MRNIDCTTNPLPWRSYAQDNCAGVGGDFRGPIGRIVVEHIDGGIGQFRTEVGDHGTNCQFFVIAGNNDRDIGLLDCFVVREGHCYILALDAYHLEILLPWSFQALETPHDSIDSTFAARGESFPNMFEITCTRQRRFLSRASVLL